MAREIIVNHFSPSEMKLRCQIRRYGIQLERWMALAMLKLLPAKAGFDRGIRTCEKLEWKGEECWQSICMRSAFRLASMDAVSGCRSSQEARRVCEALLSEKLIDFRSQETHQWVCLAKNSSSVFELHHWKFLHLRAIKIPRIFTEFPSQVFQPWLEVINHLQASSKRFSMEFHWLIARLSIEIAITVHHTAVEIADDHLQLTSLSI